MHMDINRLIANLSRKGTITATQAMIIFDGKNNQHALLMPKLPNGDEKRYAIWKGLFSLSEAEHVAREWGSEVDRIDFAIQEVWRIPEDPETMLCKFFFAEIWMI